MKQIGSYQVERELGRGGMGVVYLARDARLDRDVAIKVLPDALARDKERVLRFEREAKLLAARLKGGAFCTSVRRRLTQPACRRDLDLTGVSCSSSFRIPSSASADADAP
jgi:serine/threonine protein kinase